MLQQPAIFPCASCLLSVPHETLCGIRITSSGLRCTLHAAAEAGYYDVCEWLCKELDKDPDFKYWFHVGVIPGEIPAPLQLAMENGHNEVCEVLERFNVPAENNE